MKPFLLPTIFIVVLLSLVTSKIVYYGFTPNYAGGIFSKEAFNKRLGHDVYQYRILSKYLLFKMDDYLAKDMPEKGAEMRILIQTQNGSQRFYTAFFYLNTIFLVLTSIVLVLLLDLSAAFTLKGGEAVLMMFLVPIVICLSEFVVCCYDVSSYFFQLLALYVYLKFFERHFVLTLGILCVLIILSTMNRESSALSVSLLSLLLLLKYGLTRKVMISIGCLATCFLTTYLALRHFIVDPKNVVVLNIQAGKLFIDTNEMGLLFWVAFIYLPLMLANGPENRWMILAFHLASFPYIFTVLTDGVLWEVRLYIPLFLGSFLLSKLEPAAHTVHLTDLATRCAEFFKRRTSVKVN